MQTKLIFPLLFAVSLPTFALAGVVTDGADRIFSQPLAPQVSKVRTTKINIDNIYGQSDAMNQVLANSAKNTERSTTFRSDTTQAIANGKPLDW